MHAFHGGDGNNGAPSSGAVGGNNGGSGGGASMGYDASWNGRSPKSPKKFLFDAVSPRDEPQSSEFKCVCVCGFECADFIAGLIWIVDVGEYMLLLCYILCVMN